MELEIDRARENEGFFFIWEFVWSHFLFGHPIVNRPTKTKEQQLDGGLSIITTLAFCTAWTNAAAVVYEYVSAA